MRPAIGHLLARKRDASGRRPLVGPQARCSPHKLH